LFVAAHAIEEQSKGEEYILVVICLVLIHWIQRENNCSDRTR